MQWNNQLQLDRQGRKRRGEAHHSQGCTNAKTMCLLERTLQDNKSLLEREYADPLYQMVDIIRAGIDNLQDAVNKCWGGAGTAKSAELVVAGSTAKKALYPFRQKSLLSLNTALDSLQLELSTAMHM